jgi:hypothetical protein
VTSSGASPEEVELVRQAIVNTIELAAGYAEKQGDQNIGDFQRFVEAFASEVLVAGREDEWRAAHEPTTPAEEAMGRFVALMAAFARETQEEDAFLRHVRLAAELATRFVRFEDGSI